MCIGCHRINRLSGCLCPWLDFLCQLCNLWSLVYLPSICRTVYTDSSPTCCLELSFSSHRIMGRCKLRHIICDVLSERCIIHDQLSFFIKIQPVLDRISIQGFRFISKSIRNACFCKIVTCIKRRLQIRIVAGNICFYIHVRLTVEINRSFISRNSFRKHVISIFQIQLTSLCLRNNLKLRISICDICILRSYLILFLCTVKCLHLFFQLFFIVSRVLSGCIALLFKKTSDPFIRFLIFQKF